MTHSFDRIVIQAYRGATAGDLLDASPAALIGVSAADAEALAMAMAFGITTIRELAGHRFVHRAQAILAAAGTPAFDPGPPPDWEAFFASAPLDTYRQHPSQRFRLDFGPVIYRGRLDGSTRLIVVGQDPATNEILGHRVFVGRSGQRVQGFLAKLGITRSYTLLNTFLYSVFGQFDAELRGVSLEAPILVFRNAFLDRLVQACPIEGIVGVGAAANHALEHWPGRAALAVPLVHITHPAAHDEHALLDNWNAALDQLRPAVTADDDGVPDPLPYGPQFVPSDHVPIPRADLQFGMPDWHGVGAHGDRDGDKKIIWAAPS